MGVTVVDTLGSSISVRKSGSAGFRPGGGVIISKKDIPEGITSAEVKQAINKQLNIKGKLADTASTTIARFAPRPRKFSSTNRISSRIKEIDIQLRSGLVRPERRLDLREERDRLEKQVRPKSIFTEDTTPSRFEVGQIGKPKELKFKKDLTVREKIRGIQVKDPLSKAEKKRIKLKAQPKPIKSTIGVSKAPQTSKLKKLIIGNAQKGKFGEGVQLFLGQTQNALTFKQDKKGNLKPKITRSNQGNALLIASEIGLGAVTGFGVGTLFKKLAIKAPRLAKTIGTAGTLIWISGIPFRVKKASSPGGIVAEFAGDLGFIGGARIAGVPIIDYGKVKVTKTSARDIIKKAFPTLKRKPSATAFQIALKNAKTKNEKIKLIKAYREVYGINPPVKVTKGGKVIQLDKVIRLRGRRIGSTKGIRKGFRKQLRQKAKEQEIKQKEKIQKEAKKQEILKRKSDRVVSRLRKKSMDKAGRTDYVLINGKKNWLLGFEPKTKKPIYTQSRNKWLKQIKAVAKDTLRKEGLDKGIDAVVNKINQDKKQFIKALIKKENVKRVKNLNIERKLIAQEKKIAKGLQVKAERTDFAIVKGKKVWVLSNGRITPSRKIWLKDIKKIAKDENGLADLIGQLKVTKVKILEKQAVKTKKKEFTDKELALLKAEYKIRLEELQKSRSKYKKIEEKIDKINEESKGKAVQEVVQKDGTVSVLEKPKQVQKTKTKSVQKQIQALKQQQVKIVQQAKASTQKELLKLKIRPVSILELKQKTITPTKTGVKLEQKPLQELKSKLSILQDPKIKIDTKIQQKLKLKPAQRIKLNQQIFNRQVLRNQQQLKLKIFTNTVLENILKKSTVPKPVKLRLEEIFTEIKRKRKYKKSDLVYFYTPTLSGIGRVAERTKGSFTGFEVRGSVVRFKPIKVKRHKRRSLRNKPFVRKHRRRKART